MKMLRQEPELCSLLTIVASPMKVMAGHQYNSIVIFEFPHVVGPPSKLTVV